MIVKAASLNATQVLALAWPNRSLAFVPASLTAISLLNRLVGLASRSLFGPLLEAGVGIDEFHGGLLHAKTITVDGSIGVVMSANLDLRSYELNFECGVLVYDEAFTKRLRALQESYRERSTPAPVDLWRDRSFKLKLAQGAASVLSPLL